MAHDLRVPRPGEGWRHTKSNRLYEIAGTGHATDTGKAVVIYRNWGHLTEQERDDPQLWVRDLAEFLGWTEDHRRRFVFEREVPDGQ